MNTKKSFNLLFVQKKQSYVTISVCVCPHTNIKTETLKKRDTWILLTCL